jgi:protein involved in polysaccharide export with SLBB domain
VGDLNVIGKTEEELQKQIQTFKNLSDVIHMEFGFDSCVKIVFTKGKLV